MATRFYLPSSGTCPLTLSFTMDSTSGNAFRAPLVTTKSNTSLTNVESTFPNTTTQRQAVAMFVSPPLNGAHSFTTSELWGYGIQGLEGNAAVDATFSVRVRIVSKDGSTDRGSIVWTYTGGEFTTSLNSRMSTTVNALSAVSASDEDRIVIEIGARGLTPSTDYTWTLRFGDPTGSSDISAADQTGTDISPFFELSPNLTFKSEGTTYAASGTVEGTSATSASPARSTPTSGTVAGTSAASGAAIKTAPAAGTCAASSAQSAVATRKLVSAGTVSASGAASGTAVRKLVASGLASATSGASSTLQRKLIASGTVAATSGASASAASGVAAGTAQAVSGASGSIAAVLASSGVCSASSSTSGGVGSLLAAGGTVAGLSGVSIDLGQFVSSLTGLLGGTHYYVRAYATNTSGTSYGSVEEFDTTIDYSASGTVSATSSTSGDALARRLAEGAVHAVSGVSGGVSGGGYVSNLTNLSERTHYYVRAYATNEVGTAYGSVEEFDTIGNLVAEGVVNAVSGSSVTTEAIKTWAWKGLMGLLFINERLVVPIHAAGEAVSVSLASGSVYVKYPAEGTVSALSSASANPGHTQTSGVVGAISDSSGDVDVLEGPSGTGPDIYMEMALVSGSWTFHDTIDEWDMDVYQPQLELDLMGSYWVLDQVSGT